LTPNKPKLCIDCKQYTKDFFSSNKYGQCSLFIIENDNDYFLVNGINNHKIEYQYCAVARKYDYMCGQDGRFYEKKE
jgi:hypothetical protein